MHDTRGKVYRVPVALCRCSSNNNGKGRMAKHRFPVTRNQATEAATDKANAMCEVVPLPLRCAKQQSPQPHCSLNVHMEDGCLCRLQRDTSHVVYILTWNTSFTSNGNNHVGLDSTRDIALRRRSCLVCSFPLALSNLPVAISWHVPVPQGVEMTG